MGIPYLKAQASDSLLAVVVAGSVSALVLACSLPTGGPAAWPEIETVIYNLQPPKGADLTHAPARVLFAGKLKKFKTQNPNVLGGSNDLVNRSGAEYRILRLTYTLDHSRVREGESIETDTTITVTHEERPVSLNSGEELLSTHEYYVRGAQSSAQQVVEVPGGGFSLLPDHKLSIGSVSACFPLDKGSVTELSDERLADGEFMAMYFRVDLIRADLIDAPPTASYRSPYRDRGFVASPARSGAPYTDFENTSDEPVRINAFGVFQSSLTSAQASAQKLELFVNERLIFDMPLPEHIPGEPRSPLPMILPWEYTLQPGDVISARGHVLVNESLVFDLAVFLIAGFGLAPTNERLDIVRADFNGDGFADQVDLDASGSIWVGLTVGEGNVQDTQHEWATGLSSLDELEVRDVNSDGVVDLVARNADGLCLHLLTDIADTSFQLHYCNASRSESEEQSVYGDFNGDGWPDRFHIDHDRREYLVALGGPEGLQNDGSVWASGYGRVGKLFVWDADRDGRDDIMVEWAESDGAHCFIWRSEGDRLKKISCPRMVK